MAIGLEDLRRKSESKRTPSAEVSRPGPIVPNRSTRPWELGDKFEEAAGQMKFRKKEKTKFEESRESFLNSMDSKMVNQGFQFNPIDKMRGPQGTLRGMWEMLAVSIKNIMRF